MEEDGPPPSSPGRLPHSLEAALPATRISFRADRDLRGPPGESPGLHCQLMTEEIEPYNAQGPELVPSGGAPRACPASLDPTLFTEDVVRADGTTMPITNIIEQVAGALESCRLLQQDHAERRRMVGLLLLDVRRHFPARGPRAAGWGAFLKAVRIPERTALRYMKAVVPTAPEVSANLAEISSGCRTAPVSARRALLRAIDAIMEREAQRGPQENCIHSQEKGLADALDAYRAAWRAAHEAPLATSDAAVLSAEPLDAEAA